MHPVVLGVCDLHAYLVHSKDCHPWCSFLNSPSLPPEVQHIQWLDGASQTRVHVIQKAVVIAVAAARETRVQHAQGKHATAVHTQRFLQRM